MAPEFVIISVAIAGFAGSLAWMAVLLLRAFGSVARERDEVEEEQDWIVRSRAGYSTDWHA